MLATLSICLLMMKCVAVFYAGWARKSVSWLNLSSRGASYHQPGKKKCFLGSEEADSIFIFVPWH